MPLSLRPVTYPSGLVRWDKSALILHFFWAWQFLQACVMEAGQILTIGTAGLAGAPINYKDLQVQDIFAFLTAALIVVVVVEICMFANDYLHNNTYLFLQVVKTAYISTAFGICVGRSSCLYFPWQHHFIWRNLLMTAVYWIPWIGSLCCAIILKLQKTTVPAAVLDEERQPLIPKPVMTPRLAVDRRRS